MKRNNRQGQGGCELSYTNTSLLKCAPSSTGVPKINTAGHLTSFTSSTDLRLFLLFLPLFSFSSVPLFYFLSLSASRCLAQRQQQQQTRWEPGPGAKRWRSPAWIGMLTLNPSPSAETHLFDLRCDCVFSSPHLQLPLNHAPPPTQSSSGLSLINCFNLEKHPSSCYCFSSCFIFSAGVPPGPTCRGRAAVVSLSTSMLIQRSHEMKQARSVHWQLLSPSAVCCHFYSDWLLWKSRLLGE